MIKVEITYNGERQVGIVTERSGNAYLIQMPDGRITKRRWDDPDLRHLRG